MPGWWEAGVMLLVEQKYTFCTLPILFFPGVVPRMTRLGGPSQVGKCWASQEGGSGC